MSHNIRALIVLTLLASTLSLRAQGASVTGTITYRERMALPPGSTVEVTLEDVSRADAPAEVIARLRASTPGQPPIPFQLSFDPNRINARNRYAVRARIFDGARLLFTSTTTTLVLTQGRGTTANLVLQRAAASPEPEMSTPDPRPIPPVSTPIRPLPPVVELRNLPATFTGNVPCEGCPGVRYELNLYPDDTFFVRNTRMVRGSAAQDDLGSWVLSSDRRVIILRMASGGTERFAIRDNMTLRRLDARGRESEGGPAQDLRRVTFNPLDVRVTVSGAYAREGSETRLIECSTGQMWRVSGDGLPAVAARQPGRAGNGVGTFITVSGRLEQPAGGRDPEFKVERVETTAMRSCPPRFVSLPMDGTYWRLVSLGSTDIAAPPGARNEPSITFRESSRTFSGTGGCNRLTGRYEIGVDQLTMVAAGTMMACPSGGDHEAAFTRALAATRRYRVLGSTLELFDGQNQVLARFEGRQ